MPKISFNILLAVAAGGAIGAVGRYILVSGTALWLGSGFPFGIVIVNSVGSFLLGVLLEVSALVWSAPQELRAFLIVGFLGAFTTFSAFSFEAMTLFQRGEPWGGALYVSGSVILGIIGLISGMAVVRVILA